MRNKILVVDADKEERRELENILAEIVEAGGEIFFADKRGDGLEILKNERPQLVFLDASLVGENEDEWILEGVQIIVMRDKHETDQKSEDFVVKPLKAHQILEKCQQSLSRESASRIPPM